MIEARRLAQIGIFLLGLIHIEAIILTGPALFRELSSEGPVETSFALVYFGNWSLCSASSSVRPAGQSSSTFRARYLAFPR